MIRQRRTQTALFGVGIILMALLQTVSGLTLRGQVLLLAPAVAVLGLPHGALDLPMAEVLWPLRTRRDRTVFFIRYIGIAASVGLLWWLAPGAALAVFLIYSALHFSGDWREDGPLWRVAGGASAIGAPAAFHLQEVATIFAALGPAVHADTIAQITAACGLAAGACAVLAILLTGGFAHRHLAILELAAIWLGAAILPPLLFFTVYFCLLHSVRHLTLTLDALPDRSHALRSAAAITVVTLVGAGVGVGLLVLGAQVDAETSLMRVLFIGLAALTVPHMVLVDLFSRTGPAVKQAACRAP